MHKPDIQVDGGEILLRFDKLAPGKLSFADLGLSADDLKVTGGNLRLVFRFVRLGPGMTKTHETHLFKSPTIFLAYDKKLGESYWQLEVNGKVLKEITDPSGSNTLVLVDRNALSEAIDLPTGTQYNDIILRGDLPAEVTLSATESYIHLVEVPGSES
jgi:hypothetical protein